jgi:hypothetical protein
VSIRVMAQAWKHSRAKEGTLLTLLAISDFADDDGFAFPSLATLARKARLSVRQTQRVIRKLVEMGELETTMNAGPRGVTLYRVTNCQGVTFETKGGDAHVTQTIREPSVQINKRPSLEAVKAYGAEIKLAPDQCEAFFDHFTSNGWKVSGRAPMKDWKAALRNWKRNTRPQSNGFSRSRPNGKLPAPIYPKLPPSREVTDAELAAQRKIVREASEEFHRAQNR